MVSGVFLFFLSSHLDFRVPISFVQLIDKQSGRELHESAIPSEPKAELPRYLVHRDSLTREEISKIMDEFLKSRPDDKEKMKSYLREKNVLQGLSFLHLLHSSDISFRKEENKESDASKIGSFFC